MLENVVDLTWYTETYLSSRLDTKYIKVKKYINLLVIVSGTKLSF